MISTVAIEPKQSNEADNRSWKAQLDVTFESGPDQTIVRRTHCGPLGMQRPFYPEGDIAHVYMLHPPGGIVAGDRLCVTAQCVDGGKGLVSTPGATKFYRSDGPFARFVQLLRVTDGTLEWLPGENIFYAGSRADLRTEIRLENNQSLAWWEINCFGQSEKSELLFQGAICSTLDLYRDDLLMLRERLLVEDQYPLDMSCGLRGNTVSATLLLTPMQSHSIDFVRNELNDEVRFSSTCFDSMLIVRYLGDSSEEAKSVFSRIWSGLRPALNFTTPSIPRIWAT